MSKKNTTYIVCMVIVFIIIVLAICFVLTAKNFKNAEIKPTIIITKYESDLKKEKVIEITDRKQIMEIKKLCKNLSLEQDDTSIYLAIKNDIKVDLGNGEFFLLQKNLKEYCYYENAKSDIKLVIKMPQGLLEKTNNILAEK